MDLKEKNSTLKNGNIAIGIKIMLKELNINYTIMRKKKFKINLTFNQYAVMCTMSVLANYLEQTGENCVNFIDVNGEFDFIVRRKKSKK